MVDQNRHRRNYLLAALLGAFGGGVAVLLATDAVPKLMRKAMCSMMVEMSSGSLTPEEM